jgi:hypothetical protein
MGPILGFGFRGRRFIWPSVAPVVTPVMVAVMFRVMFRVMIRVIIPVVVPTVMPMVVLVVVTMVTTGGGDHGKQLADGGRRGPERGRLGLITDPGGKVEPG